MNAKAKHGEWLDLLDERKGAFLSAEALAKKYPDGLEWTIPMKLAENRAKLAYKELTEIVDRNDERISLFQQEWIKFVLREVLELHDVSLKPREEYPAESDDSNCKFYPDYVLIDGDGKPVFFVVARDWDENLEKPSQDDAWIESPIDKTIRLCKTYEVNLALVTNGEDWTIVSVPRDLPSGYGTWRARYWDLEPKTFQAFATLFNVRNLRGRDLDQLFVDSYENQNAVTTVLGLQVRRAVEVLLQGLDRADADRGRELLKGVDARELYEAALTVMMRLLFLLCAEEQKLIVDNSPLYDDCYAVSTLRAQLQEDADKLGDEVLERRCDAWSRLLSTFRLIYAGSDVEDVAYPACGGSLFDPDRFPFLEGRPRGSKWEETPATPLPIDNRTVLLLLRSLQIVNAKDGAETIPYGGLDVEQLGYVYEGLLENTAIQTKEPILGLESKKGLNARVPLADLETWRFEGVDKLVEKVAEATGKQPSTLKRSYEKTPTADRLDKLALVCGSDADLRERVKPFLNWLRDDAWKLPVVYPQNSYYVAAGRDRRDTGTHYTPKSLTEKIVKTTLEPLVYNGPAEGKPKEEWTLKSSKELLDLKICDPAMGSGAFLVQVVRYLGDKVVEAWAIEEEKVREEERNKLRLMTSIRSPLLGAIKEEPKKKEAPSVYLSMSGKVEPNPEDPASNVLDDRKKLAQRLVAERCVYGVDINPLAVELAKLSLWLATFSKGKPFSFLDHKLKSGDSLLGIVDVRQLYEMRLVPTGSGSTSLWGAYFKKTLADVRERRRQIREMQVRDIEDVKEQERLDKQNNIALRSLKLYADRFVGEMLGFAGSFSSKNAQKLDDLLAVVGADAQSALDPENVDFQSIAESYARVSQNKLDVDLPTGLDPRLPFHWGLEFPEVFEQGGFDAICGNPPFNGGKHISSLFGTPYRNFLISYIADGNNGTTDLVAYFYLRIYSILKPKGLFGLIACNTIAEGDTRQVGLEYLLSHKEATIISADPNVKWQGSATVVVSVVYITKGQYWSGKRNLGTLNVDYISSYLSFQNEWSPTILKQNKAQSFIGTFVLGMGFTVPEEKASHFIEIDKKNQLVLYPFMNGDDLNSNPEQKASRWIINFWDWTLENNGSNHQDDKHKEISSFHIPYQFSASDFPELLSIVAREVKPDRLSKKEQFSQKWWQFWCSRPNLYHQIGRGELFDKHPKGWTKEQFPFLPQVLVISRHARFFTPSYIKNEAVFSDSLVIFIPKVPGVFLCSSTFQDWAWKHGSRMGATTLRFTPTDCYETYPFPRGDLSNVAALEEPYYAHRKNLMLDYQLGLTALYNRFHDQNDADPGIERLRELQRELDEAVVASYGWTDLNLDHGFHEVGYLVDGDNVRYTICEETRIEILRRLALLNKEYWEEEQRSGVGKKTKKK